MHNPYLFLSLNWNTQGGTKIAEECRAKKRMVNSVFISGAGCLAINGIKWIVHLRSPSNELDCVQVCSRNRKSVKRKARLWISPICFHLGNRSRIDGCSRLWRQVDWNPDDRCWKAGQRPGGNDSRHCPGLQSVCAISSMPNAVNWHPSTVG